MMLLAVIHQGNLDIILDVVTNLERSFLEAKPFSAGRCGKRSRGGRWGDAGALRAPGPARVEGLPTWPNCCHG